MENQVNLDEVRDTFHLCNKQIEHLYELLSELIESAESKGNPTFESAVDEYNKNKELDAIRLLLETYERENTDLREQLKLKANNCFNAEASINMYKSFIKCEVTHDENYTSNDEENFKINNLMKERLFEVTVNPVEYKIIDNENKLSFDLPIQKQGNEYHKTKYIYRKLLKDKLVHK